MNILMMHPHDIYSNSEPWTVRITYLATEFVKRGHNVRLMYHLIDPRMSLEDATARQEYPFTTIPCYRGQLALFAKMKSTLEFARWADVIHFQKCFPHCAVPALWAGYRLGKPVHYDWDDWEFGIYNYNPANRLVGHSIKAFEGILPKMVDTMTVASEEIKRMAIEAGFPPARIFDGHVGADIEAFHPGIDGSQVRRDHHIEGPIVLYLGQLHGAQYLELFLASAKETIERGADATFVVVGGGERFGELFQVAENMEIGHKVIFTGAIDHDDIPRYIAAADVAVACFADTPQVRTKSPLKMCEYMAMGKAIVASQVGEVPRMLGDAGILVEPGNAGALADGIVAYLNDPKKRAEAGAKARRRAETEFNWGTTAERMLRAYEMALHETRWLNWKVDKYQLAQKGPFMVTPSGPPRRIPSSKWLKKPGQPAPKAGVRPGRSANPAPSEPSETPKDKSSENSASAPMVTGVSTTNVAATSVSAPAKTNTNGASASSGSNAPEMTPIVKASGAVDAGGGLQTATSVGEQVIFVSKKAPGSIDLTDMIGNGGKPKSARERTNGTNGHPNGVGDRPLLGGMARIDGKTRMVQKYTKRQLKVMDAAESRKTIEDEGFLTPPPPPRPPYYKLGPFSPLRDFIENHLDVMGVLDGRVAFVGPHTVQFDPTDTCPNDCIACWCRSPLLLDKLMPMEEQRQRLSIEKLEDVLDDLVKMGTKEIYIAGGGEPMAYPHILPLCESIKRRGMICNINTSFINVDRYTARELAKMRVDFMTVSVWAGSPETYVLTHPSKTEEAFWDLKDALTYLNEVKDVMPYIKTYHVLSNLNFHEIKQMVDFGIETKSESVEFTLVDTMPDRTDSLLLTKEQQQWLYEEAQRIYQWIVVDEKESRIQLYMWDQFLRRISDHNTTEGNHDKNIVDSMPCTVGWQFARVLANGNINSCLKSHRIPTGSLHETGFTDLWTNEKQEEFRHYTNVYKKEDPWFSNIGNDPNAKVGCHKACDDLGRIEHMNARIKAMPKWKMAILKAAQMYLRATGQYLR